jgi:hypothetical protein
MKISLTITTLLVSIGLYLAFYDLITPQIYIEHDSASPIGYFFIPDNDDYAGKKHQLNLSAWSNINTSIEAILFYKKKSDTKFLSLSLYKIPASNNYIGEIPTLPKGERYFYYIELKDKLGNIKKIPQNAPEKPLFYITYEGKPNKHLLTLHILLVIASLIILVHAFYWALNIILIKENSGLFLKLKKSIKFGSLSFFIGAIILGYAVAKQAFGKGWNGLPLGDDITDNKSLLTLLYWGALYFASFRIKERTTAMLIIIGTILTLIIYLIPHSYFIQ